MWLDESSDFGLPWGIAGTSLMGGFSFATLPLFFFFFYLFHAQTKTFTFLRLISCPLTIWVNSPFPPFLLKYTFFLAKSTSNFSPPSPPVLSQGLRKSSDCGRTKRTIMPHSLPHMVQLRKFILSEDAVFLLLQYAEGKTSHAPPSPSFVFFTSNCFFPLLSPDPSSSLLSALVPDRCLIEMGVCHRSLF